MTDALFLVLVGDQADRFFRVGTAWAVAPTTLVSSASVVMRMKILQDRFPQAVLFSPATNQKLAITGTKVHPQYVEAAAACDEAEKELDALLATREELSPAQVDREHLREAWLEGRLKALKAAERQVYFDVATLSVARPVQPILPLSPARGPNVLRPKVCALPGAGV